MQDTSSPAESAAMARLMISRELLPQICNVHRILTRSYLHYHPPIQDMKFLYYSVYQVTARSRSPPPSGEPQSQGQSRERADDVLNNTMKICRQIMLPLDGVGDKEGCHLTKERQVVTPPIYKSSYHELFQNQFKLSALLESGESSDPTPLCALSMEMLATGSLSLSSYLMHSDMVLQTILRHGSDSLKIVIVPKLISGIWGGTICISESQAGSDLSLISTKAEPTASGSYLLTGHKTYVSCGDHDITANIIHLVLANVIDPDTSHGKTSRQALFVVPKFRFNGSASARNGVTTSKIESTMGQRGVPLCELSFQKSEGYLLSHNSETNLDPLVTLLRYSRYNAAISGVAVIERSLQASLRYSQQRKANKAIVRSPKIMLPADPIIVHPDVRRMLLIQKSFAEGGRSMIVEHAIKFSQLEIAQKSDKKGDSQKLLNEIDFMTPILKGFLTEVSQEAVNHCVQIHAGRGCVNQFGVEQLYRDSRQLTIHHGTTGLQGYELLTQRQFAKQLPAFNALVEDHCTALLSSYSDIRRHEIYSRRGNGLTDAPLPSVLSHIAILRQKVKEWIEISHRLGERVTYHPHTLGIAAVDYLMYCGYLTLADHWLHMEHMAYTLLHEKRDASESPSYQRDFLESKIQVTSDHPLLLLSSDLPIRL